MTKTQSCRPKKHKSWHITSLDASQRVIYGSIYMKHTHESTFRLVLESSGNCRIRNWSNLWMKCDCVDTAGFLRCFSRVWPISHSEISQILENKLKVTLLCLFQLSGAINNPRNKGCSLPKRVIFLDKERFSLLFGQIWPISQSKDSQIF